MTLNPYNFVRFQEMAADARQTPVWHSATDPDLHSGQLICRIVALSPIFIPDHESVLKLPLPPVRNPRQNRARQRGNDHHNVYLHFFHLGDNRPLIAGSSLKGLFRSVAEAAVNGCLAVFSERYMPGAANKVDTPKYAEPFNLEPAVKKHHLQPCHQVERQDGEADSGLCPTCRLFGMPAPDEGEDQAGMRPNFFAGKVTFSDARLLGDPVYDDPVLLTELSSPDPTSYLYYRDLSEQDPFGRKFYYHHKELYRDTRQNQQRAASLLNAYQQEGSNDPIFSRAVDGDDGLNRKVTVRPLKKYETVFSFTVDYHNLTTAELDLLLYTLELDTMIDDKGRIRQGAYHKLGYGKPAGLGSVAIQVAEWRRLELHDERSRYSGNGTGWRRVKAEAITTRVQRHKEAFLEQHARSVNLNNLRAILWYPSLHERIAYPRYPHDFKADGGYRLPIPGREPK